MAKARQGKAHVACRSARHMQSCGKRCHDGNKDMGQARGAQRAGGGRRGLKEGVEEWRRAQRSSGGRGGVQEGAEDWMRAQRAGRGRRAQVGSRGGPGCLTRVSEGAAAPGALDQLPLAAQLDGVPGVIRLELRRRQPRLVARGLRAACRRRRRRHRRRRGRRRGRSCGAPRNRIEPCSILGQRIIVRFRNTEESRLVRLARRMRSAAESVRAAAGGAELAAQPRHG
eukprot:SAG11_NODE_6044_length_1402_cov_0.980046_1_plen_227_part_00